MKRTGFLYDDRFLLHKTGPYHPEVPERLTAVFQGIEEGGLLDKLIRITASPADMKWIHAVHAADYVKRFEATCRANKQMFESPDNQMCADTYEVALLAVGGILESSRLKVESGSALLYSLRRGDFSPPVNHRSPKP
jgi:acetoin utilization deacetylase AcuC-like enzyme